MQKSRPTLPIPQALMERHSNFVRSLTDKWVTLASARQNNTAETPRVDVSILTARISSIEVLYNGGDIESATVALRMQPGAELDAISITYVETNYKLGFARVHFKDMKSYDAYMTVHYAPSSQ